MNSFYVYLASINDSNHLSHKNSVLHFHTNLSVPIILDGEWEVALMEIFYPKKYKNSFEYYFMYTDIVDYTHVGSTTYPILRPLRLKDSNNEYVNNVEQFHNPMYIPINRKYIPSIEIQIEADAEISKNEYYLSPGDIQIVLHFRRVGP